MFQRVAVVATACLVVVASPGAGQTSGSLGLGASLIEYDGFLASGAAVFAPALRFDSPNLSLAGQANWTAFESGKGVVQGTLGAGWFTGSRGWWRLELTGSAGLSKYAAQPGSAHVLGGARVHLFGRQAGGWVGATAGRTVGSAIATPVELSAAGWHVRRRVAVVGSASLNWFGSDRYLDLLGALRWTGPGVELEARLGLRPWSQSGDQGGTPSAGPFGEVSAEIPLSARLALSVSGGTYPTDPVHRVLGARYLNAGLRILAFGKSAAAVSSVTDGLIRRRPADETATEARFEMAPDGERHRITIHSRGAAAVELMADFTDWRPVALTEVQPGVWEVALPIASGVHRLNVRIGGGPWIPPQGMRTERTEFGGGGGIILIP